MYTPINGFVATAARRVGELRGDDFEITAPVVEIDEEDLRAGRLDEAKVTEYLVHADYPWITARTSIYYVQDMRYNGEIWEARVLSQAGWLEDPVGRFFQPDCDVDVFSQGPGMCNKDPMSFLEEDVAVSEVIDEYTIFQAVDLGQANGYFKDGKITWITGPNVGTISDIKSNTKAAGRDVLEIQLPTPSPISVDDRFNMLPGCNKQPGIADSTGHCKNKYDNLDNFQGFPFMPGTDKTQKGVRFGV